MMRLLHSVLGILLLVAHGFFLFRGLAMRRHGGKPGTWDRLARAVSHIGLPAALATGVIVATGSNGFPENDPLIGGAHVAVGVLPIVAIIAFTPLLPLKRRIPWLLPALNLMFFALAVITGTLMGFVLQ